MLGHLYPDDLVLCGKSEEDLRGMIGSFVKVCRRRGLKVKACKSKVIVLGREEGLKCEVCKDGIQLKHVLEFKYLGYVLDKSSTYKVECRRKVASGRRVAGDIRSLVNARGLQFEFARVLYKSFLKYSSETMIWKEKEKSRIRAIQMDNLRGLQGVRRIDKVPNAWIREW